MQTPIIYAEPRGMAGNQALQVVSLKPALMTLEHGITSGMTQKQPTSCLPSSEIILSLFVFT